MAGYYTQNRKVHQGSFVDKRKDPYGAITDFTKPITLPQSTYSYRSTEPSGPGVSSTVRDFLKGNSELERDLENNSSFIKSKEKTNSSRGSGICAPDAELYDNGHTFDSLKTTAGFLNKEIYPRFYQGFNAWGHIAPQEWKIALDAPRTLPNFTDVNTFGNRAILATSPTMPEANLTGLLAETLQNIPKIVGHTLLTMQSKVDFFRSLGGEYLNLQFGWAPFIRDIEKLFLSVSSSIETLRQFERDSGRVVRRRFRFPRQMLESSSVEALFTMNASFGGDQANKRVRGARDLSITRDIWFSGAYVYYVPKGGDSIFGQLDRYEALVNHALGTRFTIDTLYQLAPWSWLIDWYINIGDNVKLHSLFSSDKLVLKYGYLMVKTTATETFSTPSYVGGYPDTYSNTPLTSLGAQKCYVRTERKQRFRTTPYGFGLNPDSFSPEKWAILGALGIARTPRKLP